ncbi:MAG: cobalamin-binding protein [Clostridia bacterium]|nr:corrinoid protein [Eubacteriales bacterium]MDD3866863.1 corrinoid protein [Eubacteriales bacterium]MDD4460906.1 corrinoid protein [Eubacteriales bacterium]NCC47880.1 cobalamin-binding protein [Clostridia bacterium]
MEILRQISEALQKGKAKDVKSLVQSAVDEKIAAEKILNEGLLDGMNIVGVKFKNNEVYVPDVLVAARAMKAGTAILKPLLVADGVQAIGKAVIGTVKGDLHDIGKNLVGMMLEGKGIEVIDAGTDVSAEQFISLAREHQAQLICCSALLTTTMGEMKAVVQAADAAGIRDQVTIMVGGAPVNETFAQSIGADAYAPDAATAAEVAVTALAG